MSNFPGLAGLVAAAGAFIVALLIEMMHSKSSLGNAFRNLGFKTGDLRQVLPTAVGLICIILGYLYYCIFFQDIRNA